MPDILLIYYRGLLNQGLSEEEAMIIVWGDLVPDTDYGLDNRYN